LLGDFGFTERTFSRVEFCCGKYWSIRGTVFLITLFWIVRTGSSLESTWSRSIRFWPVHTSRSVTNILFSSSYDGWTWYVMTVFVWHAHDMGLSEHSSERNHEAQSTHPDFSL